MRKIVVDGREYTYVVGTGFAVIRFDGRVIAKITLDEIKGSWDTLERGRWKKTSEGMITPSEIAEYIKERIVT